MSYKLRNREVFRATVNGKEYTITCYSQDTSYSFRHIACEGFSNTTECRYIKSDIVAKATYYNRTWERFRYETVLTSAIQKVAPDKEVAEKLHAILIDKKAQDEHEATEKFINSFKAIHESLTDENKDSLKRMVDKLPNGMITTEGQAQTLLGVASLMSITQS